MGNYLNIGNAGFVSARKGTYVDKTGMISFYFTVVESARDFRLSLKIMGYKPLLG